MPEQRGYETVTHDDLCRIRICPRADQWMVTIYSKRKVSPEEWALDTHEHTFTKLDDAQEWAAEQLAKVWLPAIEDRHDLSKYEDLDWKPVDCLE